MQLKSLEHLKESTLEDLIKLNLLESADRTYYYHVQDPTTLVLKPSSVCDDSDIVSTTKVLEDFIAKNEKLLAQKNIMLPVEVKTKAGQQFVNLFYNYKTELTAIFDYRTFTNGSELDYAEDTKQKLIAIFNQLNSESLVQPKFKSLHKEDSAEYVNKYFTMFDILDKTKYSFADLDTETGETSEFSIKTLINKFFSSINRASEREAVLPDTESQKYQKNVIKINQLLATFREIYEFLIIPNLKQKFDEIIVSEDRIKICLKDRENFYGSKKIDDLSLKEIVDYLNDENSTDLNVNYYHRFLGGKGFGDEFRKLFTRSQIIILDSIYFGCNDLGVENIKNSFMNYFMTLYPSLEETFSASSAEYLKKQVEEFKLKVLNCDLSFLDKLPTVENLESQSDTIKDEKEGDNYGSSGIHVESPNEEQQESLENQKRTASYEFSQGNVESEEDSVTEDSSIKSKESSNLSAQLQFDYLKTFNRIMLIAFSLAVITCVASFILTGNFDKDLMFNVGFYFALGVGVIASGVNFFNNSNNSNCKKSAYMPSC